jgi:tetratricopeptide (TPR) repeat protein
MLRRKKILMNRRSEIYAFIHGAILLFISWNFAVLVYAQSYTPRQAAEESQLCSDLVAKGNSSAARAHLLKLVSMPIGRTCVNYYTLGNTYISDMDKPNHRLAKVYLLEALRLNPEFGPAYRDLSYIARDDEKYDECIQLATKGLTCKMPDKTVLISRAKAYQAKHNLPAALADVNAFMKLGKKLTFKDFDFKANLEIQLGKVDDAIKTYEEAVSYRGDWAVLQIVHCLDLEHKTPEAIARVSSLIKKNKLDDDAYRIRARLLFKEKNYNGAVADLSEAIKLMPTDSDYRDRAKAYDALGQKALAQKDIAESNK